MTEGTTRKSQICGGFGMKKQAALFFLAFLFACPLGAQPAAFDWTTLFPSGLIDHAGKPVDTSTLHGKIVGLYFSAHWCPPCRQFSPLLVAFRDKNVKDFEVVFISSDKTEPDQFIYMQELHMNWPALKYHSNSANLIKARFGIKTIPTLIILSPMGETITTDGRKAVTLSPDTCLATWKAKSGLK